MFKQVCCKNCKKLLFCSNVVVLQLCIISPTNFHHYAKVWENHHKSNSNCFFFLFFLLFLRKHSNNKLKKEQKKKKLSQSYRNVNAKVLIYNIIKQFNFVFLLHSFWIILQHCVANKSVVDLKENGQKGYSIMERNYQIVVNNYLCISLYIRL